MITQPAILLLENEEPFIGSSAGHEGMAAGIMVPGAGASGFPELLTDPSYHGKLVCFTFPHVGNPGVVPDDLQSERVQVRAAAAREFSRIKANRLGVETIGEFLERQHIPAIEGIDTRRIVEILSRRGLVRAVLGCGQFADTDALTRHFEAGPEFWRVEHPGVREAESWRPGLAGEERPAAGRRVVIYDFGVKLGFLRRLAELGCSVRIVPAGQPAEATLAEKPDGVVFSAGPGVPADWPEAVRAAEKVLGKVPIFAAGVGAGVVAAAAGAKIEVNGKAHFGGQPVGRPGGPSAEMTMQAHEFWIDYASLPGAGLGLTHYNLNDNSVEGFKCGPRRILGVLFHPEAEPGPRDSLYLFREFAGLMDE